MLSGRSRSRNDRWSRRPRTGSSKVPLPMGKLGAQAIEVKLRKGIFRSRQIAEGALQHRARADRVIARLVMKRNRQLY
jgi:hypothetical protein